jgi:hypothetical protein
MQLIALALTGKGSWSKVYSLSEHENFENNIILTNNFGIQNIKPNSKTKLLEINPDKPILELKEDIKKLLQPEIPGLEVGLNIDSGTGKEHKALLCALIELGIGIKVVTIEDNQLIEL